MRYPFPSGASRPWDTHWRTLCLDSPLLVDFSAWVNQATFRPQLRLSQSGSQKRNEHSLPAYSTPAQMWEPLSRRSRFHGLRSTLVGAGLSSLLASLVPHGCFCGFSYTSVRRNTGEFLLMNSNTS